MLTIADAKLYILRRLCYGRSGRPLIKIAIGVHYITPDQTYEVNIHIFLAVHLCKNTIKVEEFLTGHHSDLTFPTEQYVQMKALQHL